MFCYNKINVCRCATQHEIFSPHQGDCHWISQCALLYAALRNLAISRSSLVALSSSLRLPHSSVALSGAGTASADYRGSVALSGAGTASADYRGYVVWGYVEKAITWSGTRPGSCKLALVSTFTVPQFHHWHVCRDLSQKVPFTFPSKVLFMIAHVNKTDLIFILSSTVVRWCELMQLTL